jgi:hypothetical protein
LCGAASVLYVYTARKDAHNNHHHHQAERVQTPERQRFALEALPAMRKELTGLQEEIGAVCVLALRRLCPSDALTPFTQQGPDQLPLQVHSLPSLLSHPPSTNPHTSYTPRSLSPLTHAHTGALARRLQMAARQAVSAPGPGHRTSSADAAP